MGTTGKMVLIVFWIVLLFAGIWLLKVATPPASRRKKKRKVRYTRKQRILLALGWTVTALGGIGLTVTFAMLGNAPPESTLM
jgi:sterol desaturase/sphingolipid hydroxylase (fatty acid hydroxylase superfamily)